MNERNKEYLELLKHPFDETSFIDFIKDLLNLSSSDIAKNFNEKTDVSKQFEENIKYYKYIAKYNDGLNNIGVFIIKLSNKTTSNSRNIQRNFVAKLLSTYDLDASIVSFYSDKETSWRISFVKKELSFGDKGFKEVLTPAKRYSYLVGEHESVHTAKEFLLKLLSIDSRKITLADIESVFDVEKVTKRFFEEYKEKYLQLKEYLDKNQDFITESEKCDFNSVEFAKKLMGQIVFLYFLQKKGWLGVQLIPNQLSNSEYTELLNQSDSVSQNLIKLFYELKDSEYVINKNELRQAEEQDINNISNIFINTEYNKTWGSGDKGFIRSIYKQAIKEHKNFFEEYLEPFFYKGLNEKRENQYFPLFNCKVPFLNGGLFEPLNGYRWSSANFNIPNNMFSNENKDGILDFLDLYNFTIDEEEPLEKEVAVDPEMLGKIFENLLEVDDRKSKGAFYTPREIVYYMCQESLANYLVAKVGVDYSEIIKFIKYGDLISQIDWEASINDNNNFEIGSTIYENIVAIDRALIDVKVADPAVGSGAFPLGILTEIVKLRNNLTVYMMIKNELGLINISELSNTEQNKRDIFDMKLQTIENCIYAVDIEVSAVDIAKLRLWLSLIVDYPNEEEPKPLPNLDCKIMQGNSLVDEYQGVKLFSENILNNSLKKYKRKDSKTKDIKDIHIQQTLQFDDSYIDLNIFIENMVELQKEYFRNSDNNQKKDLKMKIDNIQLEMVQESLKNEPKRLKEFFEASKKKQKPWFIWALEFYDVFKHNNGFDIVIGNPPYVGEDGNKNIFAPIKLSSLGKRFYQGKMDLLYFFFHLGLDLTNNKGIIALITTNYYVTADGAKKLREDIKNRSYIKNIINFNETKVFDSARGQHNLITILTKEKKDANEKCNVLNFITGGNLSGNDLSYILNDINSKKPTSNYISNEISNKNLYYGKNNYLDIRNNYDSNSKEKKIITYLSKCDIKLEDVANLYQGIASGANKVISSNINMLDIQKFDISQGDGIFILDLNNNNDIKTLNSFNEYEKSLLKPYYKNSDITKYRCSKNYSKLVLYIDRNIIDIEKIPNVYNHLKKFEPILSMRRETITGVAKFYQLQWPRNEFIFKTEKILLPYRSKSNDFAYCDVDWYFSTDCYCLISKNESNLKYILGLLNSNIYKIWFQNKGKVKGEMLEFMPTMLNETPIIIMSEEDKQKVIDCVNDLIENEQISFNDSDNFKSIEKLIEKYIN